MKRDILLEVDSIEHGRGILSREIANVFFSFSKTSNNTSNIPFLVEPLVPAQIVEPRNFKPKGVEHFIQPDLPILERFLAINCKCFMGAARCAAISYSWRADLGYGIPCAIMGSQRLGP